MGQTHILRKHAPLINDFYKTHFNEYLNYHRICAYATDYTDKHGKVWKKYETHKTPYEMFKSLPGAEQYLKPDGTCEELDKIAYAMSDNEYAKKCNAAEKIVTAQLQKQPKSPSVQKLISGDM